jgi:chromate reductase, NAD(P)H dehydrogenase (quinone)
MALRLLAFAASLRAGSWNRKLIAVAADVAKRAGAEVRLAAFSEFDMPLYNADLQAQGFPEGTQRLVQAIRDADGVLLASPEYNYSIPGTIKNAIDWVSRIKPGVFRDRSALLLSASNGQFGGIRGLWQLRIPLEGCGVHVYPDMYALPWAEKQFGADGGLVEPERMQRLEAMIGAYLKTAAALSHVANGG